MNTDKDVFHLIKSNTFENIKTPKKSTQYYINSFKKIKSGLYTFNFAAFFFGMFWLLYRKMYVFAFCHFIVFTYTPLPYMLSSLAFGFFANSLYLHHLTSKFMDGKKTLGVNTWVIPLMILFIFLLNMRVISETNVTPCVSYRQIKL